MRIYKSTDIRVIRLIGIFALSGVTVDDIVDWSRIFVLFGFDGFTCDSDITNMEILSTTVDNWATRRLKVRKSSNNTNYWSGDINRGGPGIFAKHWHIRSVSLSYSIFLRTFYVP